MIGFLAVSKAGKIVVPVDPDWPDSRVSEVCAQSGAALVVADAASALRRVSGRSLGARA